MSEGVWDVGAAGGESEDEVGSTIAEAGGSVPVGAGLSVLAVLWTAVEEGSSGVELRVEDGGAATVDVRSSGVELGTDGGLEESTSGVELGAEDGGATTVDVRSSGVELGTGRGLEEATSGVVATEVLSGAGAEETTGTSSDDDDEDKDEDAGADGA